MMPAHDSQRYDAPGVANSLPRGGRVAPLGIVSLHHLAGRPRLRHQAGTAGPAAHYHETT
jgi:hypothetical protein